MKIRRTANAGVLLKLDGVEILLDGVCREVKPYSATPPEEKAQLEANWPQIVAFTHHHMDHYDPDFAAQYQKQTSGVVLEPNATSPACVGNVKITPVASRHLGAAGKFTSHVSFVIEGSRCVWFMGDSAPLQWRKRNDLPKPDVIIAPYAYANTQPSWALTKSLGAQYVVLLHLPESEPDEAKLFDSVKAATNLPRELIIPEIGQIIEI